MNTKTIYPYYAILKVGCVKIRYTLRQVISNNFTIPVNGEAYSTLDKAKSVANELGLSIKIIGDSYEII